MHLENCLFISNMIVSSMRALDVFQAHTQRDREPGWVRVLATSMREGARVA